MLDGTTADSIERMERVGQAIQTLRRDVLARGADEDEERAVSAVIALLEGDLVDDARLVLHARTAASGPRVYAA